MNIRRCNLGDFDAILSVINDAAIAYKGVIPEDCWHMPYMSRAYLAREIEDGVCFWSVTPVKDLAGVMGIQDKGIFVFRRPKSADQASVHLAWIRRRAFQSERVRVTGMRPSARMTGPRRG